MASLSQKYSGFDLRLLSAGDVRKVYLRVSNVEDEHGDADAPREMQVSRRSLFEPAGGQEQLFSRYGDDSERALTNAFNDDFYRQQKQQEESTANNTVASLNESISRNASELREQALKSKKSKNSFAEDSHKSARNIIINNDQLEEPGRESSVEAEQRELQLAQRRLEEIAVEKQSQQAKESKPANRCGSSKGSEQANESRQESDSGYRSESEQYQTEQYENLLKNSITEVEPQKGHRPTDHLVTEESIREQAEYPQNERKGTPQEEKSKSPSLRQYSPEGEILSLLGVENAHKSVSKRIPNEEGQSANNNALVSKEAIRVEKSPMNRSANRSSMTLEEEIIGELSASEDERLTDMEKRLLKAKLALEHEKESGDGNKQAPKKYEADHGLEAQNPGMSPQSKHSPGSTSKRLTSKNVAGVVAQQPDKEEYYRSLSRNNSKFAILDGKTENAVKDRSPARNRELQVEETVNAPSGNKNKVSDLPVNEEEKKAQESPKQQEENKAKVAIAPPEKAKVPSIERHLQQIQQEFMASFNELESGRSREKSLSSNSSQRKQNAQPPEKEQGSVASRKAVSENKMQEEAERQLSMVRSLRYERNSPQHSASQHERRSSNQGNYIIRWLDALVSNEKIMSITDRQTGKTTYRNVPRMQYEKLKALEGSELVNSMLK